jgi:hypothetical protein
MAENNLTGMLPREWSTMTSLESMYAYLWEAAAQNSTSGFQYFLPDCHAGDVGPAGTVVYDMHAERNAGPETCRDKLPASKRHSCALPLSCLAVGISLLECSVRCCGIVCAFTCAYQRMLLFEQQVCMLLHCQHRSSKHVVDLD